MASPSGLVNLNRDRQILTRFQDLRIRQTFPFLSLPAELRNMIYELCFDVSTIEKYFDRFYERIREKPAKKTAKILQCKKITPSIFLINRQIFSEAVSLLSKQHINFHHGIFNLGDVTKAVSENVLQQVSSLTITVKGHPILQPNILRESWSGHMDLLTQLSTILAGGHKLKNLTIDFADPELTIHITQCWDAGPDSYKCDFRDHMAEAFKHLRSIRGVGLVTLKGFPPCLAPKLKARMESKPKSFLDLPGEIRNMTYAYSADFSSVNTNLHRFMNSVDRKKPLPTYPTKSTPTILLLNKRSTAEALSILRAKPLRITFPATHTLEKQDRVPNLSGFITQTSLQQLQHLDLRLEKWEWLYSLEDLIKVLAAKHSLKTFRLYLADSLKVKFLQGVGWYYPDKALHEALVGLKGIRGVESVFIEGDLPKVYTAPLVQIMQGPVDAKEVAKLMGVSVTGAVVDVEGQHA